MDAEHVVNRLGLYDGCRAVINNMVLSLIVFFALSCIWSKILRLVMFSSPTLVEVIFPFNVHQPADSSQGCEALLAKHSMWLLNVIFVERDAQYFTFTSLVLLLIEINLESLFVFSTVISWVLFGTKKAFSFSFRVEICANLSLSFSLEAFPCLAHASASGTRRNTSLRRTFHNKGPYITSLRDTGYDRCSKRCFP